MTAETFTSGPDASEFAATGETAPKRARSTARARKGTRTRASTRTRRTLDTPHVSARRSRPPGSSSRRSLANEIGGMLATFNLALLITPFAGDMLDDAEITALAKAVDDAAGSNATIHKYLSTALAGGGGIIGVVMVVGMIAARRASRHGMLPPETDATVGNFLSMMTNQNASVPFTVVDGATPEAMVTES